MANAKNAPVDKDGNINTPETNPELYEKRAQKRADREAAEKAKGKKG